MYDNEKSLIWIGSSKKDLIALPVPVRKFFGHALHFAQNGEQHDAAKVLKGFGSAGVSTPKREMEVIHARLKMAEAIAREMRYGKKQS